MTAFAVSDVALTVTGLTTLIGSAILSAITSTVVCATTSSLIVAGSSDSGERALKHSKLNS
ncbi:hypothetical protein ASZ86_02093 [Vibrio cholerae]|nr:hypothetical protein ASZ85_02028 [Vibrio cholerae]APF83513.1 hypothetical protein ASZ86_02093 [Vibrio cholerae]EAZ72415.1 hypothetical protein A5C_2108 [Vibrio cholerae NCTC 8457]